MKNYTNPGLSGPVLPGAIFGPHSHCYRRWVLLPVFFLAFQASIVAQHNLILYNMRQVPQSNALNPGQMPMVKGYFGFPLLSGIKVGAGNSGFSFRQLDMANGNDLYDFDFAGLGRGLKSDLNRLVIDNEIRLLSLGGRVGKGFYSVDIGETVYFSGTTPREMLTMFHNIQQYQPESSQVEMIYDLSSQDLNGAAYRSYSVGYAHQVIPNLSVGGRFRYLQGYLGAWTENRGLMFRYPGDGDDFQVLGRMNLLMAGYNRLNETFTNDEDSFNPAFFLKGSGNNGFAVDFGGVYQLNDRIELSFSAVNLGQIAWKKDVNYTVVGDQLVFSATDIEAHLESWEDVADDLVNGEPVNSQVRFTTPLPQRYHIGGNYYFGSSGSVGLLINPVRYNGVTDLSLALSGNLRAGTLLGLSAAVIHNRYAPVDLGVGLSFDLGALQLYAISDHLLSAFDWEKAQAVQAQFGINFTSGRMRRAAAAPRAEPLAALPEAPVPTAETARPKRRSKDAALSPAEDVPAPVESAPTPPKAVEPPVVTPAVAAAPASARFFTLSGTARNAKNGEILKGIAVEVYQTDPQGGKELAFTGSFYSGKLSITLSRGFSHQVIVSRQGFEPGETFLEATQVAGNEAEVTLDFALQPATPADPPLQPPTPAVSPAAEAAAPAAAVPTPPAPVASQPEPPASPAPAPATASEGTPPSSDLGTYRLTGSTSLRSGPSHTTEVLLRLQEGDRVAVLEKTDAWWWKVNFRGRTGYVKAELLTR